MKNVQDKKYTIVYNKEIDSERKIKIEKLDEFMSLGYVIGRRPFTQEHKDKIGKSNSISLKGNVLPEDVKLKISKSVSKTKTGKKHSKERREANSKAQRMCRWYTNGVYEKRCYPKNKPDGWIEGRLPMREEIKKKCSVSHKGKKLTQAQLEIRASKEYLTKKKNNSFNTSKPEEKLYEQLLKENVNKTIFRRYKEDRYPFYCDFYILEDDLFIELNAHWTHGGRPYDPNDEWCQKQLSVWKEKAKTSQFYENAIKTWTERDVKKQRIAKENNLNYKIIY